MTPIESITAVKSRDYQEHLSEKEREQLRYRQDALNILDAMDKAKSKHNLALACVLITDESRRKAENIRGGLRQQLTRVLKEKSSDPNYEPDVYTKMITDPNNPNTHHLFFSETPFNHPNFIRSIQA